MTLVVTPDRPKPLLVAVDLIVTSAWAGESTTKARTAGSILRCMANLLRGSPEFYSRWRSSSVGLSFTSGPIT